MARSLTERRALEPAASMWVATEYAQALGYQVRPYAEAARHAAAGDRGRAVHDDRAERQPMPPTQRRSRKHCRHARASPPAAARAVLAAGAQAPQAPPAYPGG